MAAQPTGEESCRTPLRQVDRGAAVLRPDQAMRGRVGSAPGQPRKTQWRQAPPIRRETPRLGRQHLLLSRPQQADTAATSLPSWRPLLGLCRGSPEEHLDGAARRSASPIRRRRSRPSPPLLWARIRSTTTLGSAPAMRPSTRVPLHPEQGVSRPPASGIEPARGEAAEPVRAKPKSPAQRATPNNSFPRPRLNQSF